MTEVLEFAAFDPNGKIGNAQSLEAKCAAAWAEDMAKANRADDKAKTGLSIAKRYQATEDVIGGHSTIWSDYPL